MLGKFKLISILACHFLTSHAFAAPATEAEIALLYRSVLGREQDEAGAAAWKKSGLSIEEIKKGFLESDEYKNKLAAKAPGAEKAATEEEIAGVYRKILKREPDPGGAKFWKDTGLGVKALEESFKKSEEYLAMNKNEKKEELKEEKKSKKKKKKKKVEKV